MRWSTRSNNNHPFRQWHRWFAWHPVTVDKGDTVWWDMVERRAVWLGGGYDGTGGYRWQHRLPRPLKVDDLEP